MIPFGEYLPDQADLDNPGVVTAKNVLPYARGFGPVPALSAYSSALTARGQGAFSCEDKAGTAYNFAGDATKLYSLALDGTWSNVTTRPGGMPPTARTVTRKLSPSGVPILQI